MHLGLDYGVGEDGQLTVLASCDGQVVSVLHRGGYGLVVEIDHGEGFLTRYAKLTSAQVELGESDRAELEQTLNFLDSQEEEHPLVQAMYFLPDARKEGGAYVTVTGRLKRIDQAEGTLLLQEGMRIPIRDIRSVGITGPSRE